MNEIDKKQLKHFAELARIDLQPGEEGELLEDLRKILEYFNELKEVNTDNVDGMTGGTVNKNVVREDEPERTDDTGKGKDQFPDVKKGFLKIPPVFE